MNDMNNVLIYESLGIIKQTLRNHKNHGLKQDKMIADLARMVTRNGRKTAWGFLMISLTLSLMDARIKYHDKEINELKKELEGLKTVKGE